MRVIAELPHPKCKITIFQMNQKYIIKLESGAYEQSYKIAEINIVGGVNALFEMLDDSFINTVVERFDTMHKDFSITYNKYQL